MKSQINLYLKLIALFFVMALFGCSPKLPEGMPKLFPVQVELTYEDGSPVSNAFLSFRSIGGEKKWTMTATTNDQGIGIAKTHGRYPGIPAGNWKVVLTKEVVEGPEDPGAPNSDDPESVRAWEAWNATKNQRKKFSLISLEYTSTESTPLEIKVAPSGSQKFQCKAGVAGKYPIQE